MIRLKKIFNRLLTEQPAPKTGIPAKDELDAAVDGVDKLKNAVFGLGDAMKDAGLQKEGELEEAELVNHMYDYKGGVEYILRDPSQAQEVAESITRWTERKGFTIITQNISKSGKIGYFHFRLGPDPERDAQRIQGYFSSKIEIAKYRFRVREARQRRRPQQTPQI